MLTNLMTFVFAFVASVIGLHLYIKVAQRNKIISSPNFRTLHLSDAITGGGVVFSLVFFSTISYFWLIGFLTDKLFFVLGIGGFFATLLGFLDDLFSVSAIKKLFFHTILSAWSIYWLELGTFLDIDWIPHNVSIGLSLLFLVWMINAYNFIDGIDGLAISGATFISGGLILIMIITNNSSELTIIYFSLLACALAFMIFNWPPARIFMGDSGSIFLGYIIGTLFLLTIKRGDITVWTWLVIFGYFFADTTVTQLMRLLLVKKWYNAHRSHAYQNLARITGSHLKVTSVIIIYHFAWLLPLMIFSIKLPDLSMFFAALAVFPAMLFAIKYGPLKSSS